MMWRLSLLIGGRMKKGSKILSMLLVICMGVAISLFQGCSEDSEIVEQLNEEDTLPTVADLEVVQEAYIVFVSSTDGGFRQNVISGKLKNNSTKTIKYIIITFNLYKDGSRIGTVEDMFVDFEVGYTWRYFANKELLDSCNSFSEPYIQIFG